MSGKCFAVYRAKLRRGARSPVLWWTLGLPCLVSATLAATVHAQTTVRTVEGKALNGSGAPLPGSIVYLQDQKTNIVKTYIATDDGSYRFGQLSTDTDYLLWAKYKGEKSKDKLISSFDTKPVITYDFHIGK